MTQLVHHAYVDDAMPAKCTPVFQNRIVVVGPVSFPYRQCALSRVWDAAHHCQRHCWLLSVFSPLSAYLASLLQECSALPAV